MSSEDGHIFVKHLAHFVRTHERALANALLFQRSKARHGRDHTTIAAPSSSSAVSSAPEAISLSEALSRPIFPFSSTKIKAAKLALTPHHLFYLLTKFEDLGVEVGPTNVRLENLHHDAAHSNYVSFLGRAPKSRGKPADTESLKSVSSVRSVMSSMSSMWSGLSLSNSAAKAEKQMLQYSEDIRYLYSSFTKIPALRLSPDHRARLIAGFEEFPFDTAVPLFVFKNVSVLEICDLDFRQFHGWDRLSEQLRSLTVKRAGVDEPLDLLQSIVLDDTEKRRKRSSKSRDPGTPSMAGQSWPLASSRSKQTELARSTSAPNSPLAVRRRASQGSSTALAVGAALERKNPSAAARRPSSSPSRRSASPPEHRNTPGSSRGVSHFRRSSDSSGSSPWETTPRHSSSDLHSTVVLPSSKWRFLKHLSLTENGLTHLMAVSLTPVVHTLQSLDLSGNLFTEIPEALASLTHLRALNLSNCMIDSLQSLLRSPLPAISALNLCSNRLLSLAGVERLYSLERIDLRDNRLHDPTELARLTGMPEISDVFVAKNPFTRTHPHYRITIFNVFRATPGRTHDITIDTLGPQSGETRYLIDRALEAASKPVVKTIQPDNISGISSPRPQLVAEPPIEPPPRQYLPHHPSSDPGLSSTVRRKKALRRRVVELYPDDPSHQLQEDLTAPGTEPPVPELIEIPPRPHTPNTESDQPTTPENTTPYHTAPSTQLAAAVAAAAAAIPARTPDAGLPTPTRPPRIVDLSDGEESPPVSAGSPDSGAANSDGYRQKMASLKSELGANWLSALGEERRAAAASGDESPRKDDHRRSFSPSSRTSTVRPPNERTPTGVSVGGARRTLG